MSDDLDDRDDLTDEEKAEHRRRRKLNAEREAKMCPSVAMVMKPVDGGRAVIGMIECPHCGREHLTTQIKCGELVVFCGLNEDGDTVGVDGHSRVMVERIL
jgi:hypothetical protein